MKTADAYLCDIMRIYYEEAGLSLEFMSKLADSQVSPHIRSTLTRRWEQIRALIRSAFQNGINPCTQSVYYQKFDTPPPIKEGANAKIQQETIL